MQDEEVIYVAGHPFLNRRCIQDFQGVSASKMTCIVSGEALNSIHSPLKPRPDISNWKNRIMQLSENRLERRRST